ncbi:hypothetical protein M2451_000559 [Dysgonomonas sp. PFB1-18]|uniref:WG repeat-containing protein n=1 Tax=unclassified Dysgonomonas TaxID=2630389 RepID=UPI0024764092|nr:MULTISPECIES: WG repeat-containing protein [unclassified Dysgonomonas]MDH6307410.1 hypothetical protein [Dysgonomonas sp. PF1-14]MDH6337328.1 hypothetical protein [Dysgonomonas sp. PF1-16]MDH6379252.1 hypothetical protein [Dysgonomonas sp. PFB1-18]MDH6396110.1 hypothetical protein [Dysgonomonas sp. PF1-23]
MIEKKYNNKEYNFDNQLYITEEDGRFGFLNKSEKEISPPIFDFYHIYQGFAVVRKGNQVGNLFFHEGVQEPLKYRTVEIFEIVRNGRYGVDSVDGTSIIPYRYDYTRIYYKIIVCKLNEGYYLFNTKGEPIIDIPFQDVDLTIYQNYRYFNPLNSSTRELTIERGISVKTNNKWGVISQKGKWIIQPSVKNANDIELFQHIQPHQGWYYILKDENDRKGIANEYGKQIVPCLYDEIIVDNLKIADNGRAFIVKTGEKYGLYSTNGKLILPCSHDWINYIIDDIYLTVCDKSQKVMNFEKVLNIEWDECQELDSNCVDVYSLRLDVLLSIGMSFYHDLCYPQYQPCTKNVLDDVDIRNAIKWYLFAAELGNDLAITACYNAYKYGIGVSADMEIANRYLKRLPNCIF